MPAVILEGFTVYKNKLYFRRVKVKLDFMYFFKYEWSAAYLSEIIRKTKISYPLIRTRTREN